jgi:hypothetical protein
LVSHVKRGAKVEDVREKGCRGSYFGLRKKLQETGQNCIMKGFIIPGLTSICSAHQIKAYEMGGTCGTHGEKILAYRVFGTHGEKILAYRVLWHTWGEDTCI